MEGSSSSKVLWGLIAVQSDPGVCERVAGFTDKGILKSWGVKKEDLKELGKILMEGIGSGRLKLSPGY